MNAEKTVIINEDMLSSLRERVKEYQTEKRYLHTLAVEREALRLGEIYFPNDPQTVLKLRAAALLHDITKVLSLEKQLQYCQKFGIMVRNSEMLSPKLFHARTAVEFAKRDFPEFADETVLSGVRWHTTGRRGMSTFECIVYLADYIEDTRTFDDCVRLRSYFYDEMKKDGADKDDVLVSAMVMSFDLTVKNLIEEGSLIDSDTVDARNYFIEILRERQEGKNG